MLATAFFGEPDETASAVDRRGMDGDQAIALEKTKHLAHRGPLDIEALCKRVHRNISGFPQRRQSEELRNAQACWFEMSVIETRDLPRSLPRDKAIALIDPKRLVRRRQFAPSFY